MRNSVTSRMRRGSIFNADEITIPRRILSKPEPSYTEEARRAGVEGKVVLLAVLAADGNVKHVLLLQPLSYGLTEEAITAARKIKFEPTVQKNIFTQRSCGSRSISRYRGATVLWRTFLPRTTLYVQSASHPGRMDCGGDRKASVSDFFYAHAFCAVALNTRTKPNKSLDASRGSVFLKKLL